MYDGIGKGLELLFGIGIIAVIISILSIGYIAVDSIWLDDTHKVKHRITPEVIIRTESVNGIVKSDTTYIYKFDEN